MIPRVIDCCLDKMRISTSTPSPLTPIEAEQALATYSSTTGDLSTAPNEPGPEKPPTRFGQLGPPHLSSRQARPRCTDHRGVRHG